MSEEQAKYNNLYQKANELLLKLAIDGNVNQSDNVATKLMDALKEIDGGEWIEQREYDDSTDYLKEFCWFTYDSDVENGIGDGFIIYTDVDSPISDKPDHQGHIWKSFKLYKK